MFSSSALVFVGNALLVAAMAQETALRPPTPNIRVNSDLVLINASITESHGTPVIDIAPSRFHLFEDGIEQTIRYCVSEDSPVSIGLVLDTSGSMGDKLAAVKKAAMQFVRAANPGDEFFLVIFRYRPEVVVPFTSDTQRLISKIESAEAGGSTALLDAFYLALQQARRGQNSRKALLVVSDGMDNHSRYSTKEVKGLAREVEFPIYTINMWQPDRSGNRYAMQRRDPGFL
jgi:Ca-activated chloride channel family protein